MTWLALVSAALAAWFAIEWWLAARRAERWKAAHEIAIGQYHGARIREQILRTHCDATRKKLEKFTARRDREPDSRFLGANR